MLTCRALAKAHSTVYAIRAREGSSPRPPRKRGRKTDWTHVELTERIREVIATSRGWARAIAGVWARLRKGGVRTSKKPVLRVTREASLLAPTRSGRAHGPKAHDGTIATDQPDEMWGTGPSGCLADEGHAAIFTDRGRTGRRPARARVLR